MMGNASTGYDGSTTKGSESARNNMKHAMKRKVNLPSAMPRKQDVIYDLNGRPLYRGGYLRAVELQNHEFQGADLSGE